MEGVLSGEERLIRYKGPNAEEGTGCRGMPARTGYVPRRGQRLIARGRKRSLNDAEKVVERKRSSERKTTRRRECARSGKGTPRKSPKKRVLKEGRRREGMEMT